MKERYMYKILHTLHMKHKHLFSMLFSTLCMAVSIAASALYPWAGGGDVDAILLFIFALIIISCITANWIYGLFCSLLSALWLGLTQNLPPHSLAVTFLGMTAITGFISILVAHLTAQSKLIAEREKQLVEADKEKNRANLLRAISHDLRTPLSGILGNCLIFLENQPLLSEAEKTQIVTNIQESSGWLINMVENLLSITRIREDGPTITTNSEIVEEVLGEALQKMEKRHPGCKIRVKIPDDFIMLDMDVVLIEQVLLNLLENAVLHSGSEEPVDIIVEDGPESVSFTIRDYGNGIPESMLNSLFEGTYYSAVHASDAQKGMGIGLVICKTIINAHKGTILGRNHACGAEFLFTLPKKKEESP